MTYHAHGVDRLKTEMCDVWLKSSPNASWTDLITALRAMDEDRVASDIEAEWIPCNERIIVCQNICMFNKPLLLLSFQYRNQSPIKTQLTVVLKTHMIDTIEITQVSRLRSNRLNTIRECLVNTVIYQVIMYIAECVLLL